jgi:hypothetical protein
MTMKRVGNLTYVEGFPDGHFAPYVAPPAPAIDPNHIAFVMGKYYLGGVEIPAEQGEPLLEKALKAGGSHTIFQPIKRH